MTSTETTTAAPAAQPPSSDAINNKKGTDDGNAPYGDDAPPRPPSRYSWPVVKQKGISGLKWLIPPIFQWLPAYNKSCLITDIPAGVVMGCMLVPQGLAYATLAEIPVENGLYCSLVSSIAYGIFGRCAMLSVGPTAEITTILLGENIPKNIRAVQFQAISFCVGILSLALSMVNGGKIITMFLSKQVATGFTTAAAILVLLLQVKTIINVKAPSAVTLHDCIKNIINGIRDYGDIYSLYSLLLFSAYFLYLASMRYITWMPSWIPHQLVVLIVSILITYFARLDDVLHLFIVKKVPSTLPEPISPDLGNLGSNIAVIISVTIISFLQCYSIACKFVPRVDANRELFANGIVMTGCGIFQAFPTSASLARSSVAYDRNASTPLTSVVAGIVLIVAIVGLARADVFYYLPQHALAAIICAAVYRMVDFSEPISLWKNSKPDLLVWAVTFFCTLFAGLTVGVLTGIGCSLLIVIARVARPRTAEVGLVPNANVYHEVYDDPELLVYPEIILWRFDGPLYFINIGYFETALTRLSKGTAGNRRIQVVVVNCSRIQDIDASAIMTFAMAVRNIEHSGLTLYFACISWKIMARLEDRGVIETVGREKFFDSMDERVCRRAKICCGRS
eukprot:PhF_6_TR44228/c0_g1_i2/m.67973